MNLKWLDYFVLLNIFFIKVYPKAVGKYSVSGTVKDAKTRETLIGATVI